MKMKQKFSDENVLNIICIMGVVFLALSLIPILLLSFYNYPCADDFSAADTVYRAWKESGSFMEVLKAAVENVIYNYKEWSGVFASVFWTSLQPGIFGEKFYAITTWVTITLLVLSIFYFSYVLFYKLLKVRWQYWVSISTVFLYLMIHCMPSGVEGLYWHPGAANYTWAHAFFIFLLALCLSNYEEKNKVKKILKLFLASLMSVFVGGGNYITSLQACLWMGLIIVCFFIHSLKLHASKKEGCSGSLSYRKIRIPELTEIVLKLLWFIIPATILIISFLISIMAPGNQVRMAVSEGMSPIMAIVYSYRYAVEIPLREWFVLPMIPGFVISFLFMIKIAQAGKIPLLVNRKYLLVTCFISLSAVAAGFTPNLYAQGRMEAGRLHNTVYFIWIMMIYLLLYILASYFVNVKERKLWLSDKVFGKYYYENLPDFHGRDGHSACYEGRYRMMTVYHITLAGVVCLMILWIIMPGICVGSEAMESLVSGQAKAYKIQQQERLTILLDPQVKTARLPFLKNPPTLLLFQDITPDANEWINQAVAGYYGKEQVVGVEER